MVGGREKRNGGNWRMFRYEDKVDRRSGVKHRNYYLTQGDSFGLVAKMVGEEADVRVVASVRFKLGLAKSECDIEYIFGKDYEAVDGEWLLVCTSDETKEWKASCENGDEPYVYEIEVRYIDGGVDTVEQSSFTVEPQIKGD